MPLNNPFQVPEPPPPVVKPPVKVSAASLYVPEGDIHDIYPNLAARVRDLRLDAEMTQRELALKVGVTRGAIGNFEIQAQGLSAPNLCRLAAALGQEVCELLKA